MLREGISWGGFVAGFRLFLKPFLAIVAVWAVATSVATAAEIVRLAPKADETAPLALTADEVHTWTDGAEKVYVLGGNVLVEQGRNTITAPRVVVWTNATKPRGPLDVVLYADAYDRKQVRVEVVGEKPQVLGATIFEFKAGALGRLGRVVREQSLADSSFYKEARKARSTAVPDAGIKTVSGVKELPPTILEPKRPLVEAPLEVRPPKKVTIEPAQFVRPPNGLEPELPKSPASKSLPKDNLEEVPPPQPVVGNTVIPLPLSSTRTIWASPRTNRPFNLFPMTVGKENVLIITGGIKILVKFPTGTIRSLSVEADQVVIWKKGGNAANAFDEMSTADGSQSSDGVELFLAGNVVLRYGTLEDQTKAGVQLKSQTLRAEKVYYDVENHKAIAIHGDLEYTKEGFANTGHMSAQEIWQLNSSEFTGMMAELHASRLPSDPGFKLTTPQANIYRMPREAQRTIFGLPFRDRLTGSILEDEPQMLEASDVVTRLRDVPVFWWPRVKTNLNDPFGPFMGLTFRQDRLFGTQLYATWDVLDLIGVTKLNGETWTMATDYLSRRGPALGTDYALNSTTMLGMDAPFQTTIKGYFLQDKATDILSGPRQDAYQPTSYRGRFLLRHQQDFGDLTIQAQLAYLSDRNFHEMYYKFDYDLGPNQETFLWAKYQRGNAAATVLAQPDFGRDWVTETHWLPKVSGFLIGESFLDRITYHTWGSAAYARLDPYRQPAQEMPYRSDFNSPPPESQFNGGRFDWMQRVSVPFNAGSFKLVPYGTLDTSFYTNDIEGSQRGRAVGGVGMKSTLPMSRLYRDVQSDLLYLDGLHHKNEFSTNYYLASATSSYTMLHQLDRLNDDATEQAWRDYTPWHPYFDPTMNKNGYALSFSPIFNPRYYAVRRLIDTSPDNLDSVHVVQLDWRQRLQTKRGYPGLEHTVDWLTFDLSASLFPTPKRDNFNSSIAFIEYYLNWNVGDRTGVFSSGWVDPYDFGARYWSVGATFNRDDRTRFTLSYRSADPIHTRIVSASANYVFSPKYAVTAVTAFDFGNQNSLSNSLFFTRIGTDMQVTVGFTYNALVNNFGFTVNIVPNLIATRVNSPDAGGGSILGGNNNQDRR